LTSGGEKARRRRVSEEIDDRLVTAGKERKKSLWKGGKKGIDLHHEQTKINLREGERKSQTRLREKKTPAAEKKGKPHLRKPIPRADPKNERA